MEEAKHDCVARLDEQLAEHNTRLVHALSFSDPGRELIQVTTVKASADVRKKPMVLYASFCPFCGISLNPKKAKPSTGSTHAA